MDTKKKTVLIVDDTDIDRITLRTILSQDFDVWEAESGRIACTTIAKQSSQLSAILLDISMPDMSGFSVLEFMEEKGLQQIPVFLVTAEPTVDNVQRAMRYHIAEFIGKPFQREDIIRRLRARLDSTWEPELKPEELEATRAYISELEGLYRAYLGNHGRNDVPYRIVSGLVHILLEGYQKKPRERRFTDVGMELISKAAYFCDIGEMLIPCQWFQPMVGDPRYQELRMSHTVLGAKLVRLNRDSRCTYFVELCADMCLHHHERYDGQGYPDRLSKENQSVYHQLCRLADEFEIIRSGAYDNGEQPVSQVLSRLADGGAGMVDPALGALLKSCEPQITSYYQQLYQGA